MEVVSFHLRVEGHFSFEEVFACVIDPCRHQKSRYWWALFERLKWNVLFYLYARREPTLYSMYCIIRHSTILSTEMALCNSVCCIMPSAYSNGIIFFPTPCLLLNESPSHEVKLKQRRPPPPPSAGSSLRLIRSCSFPLKSGDWEPLLAKATDFSSSCCFVHHGWWHNLSDKKQMKRINSPYVKEPKRPQYTHSEGLNRSTTWAVVYC